MSNTYKHRQIGTLMGVFALFVLLLGLVLVRTLSLRGEQYSWLIVGLPILITVITLALFSVLEVTIDAQHLTWRFLPFITSRSHLPTYWKQNPPVRRSYTGGEFTTRIAAGFTTSQALVPFTSACATASSSCSALTNLRRLRTQSIAAGRPFPELKPASFARPHDCQPAVIPEC